MRSALCVPPIFNVFTGEVTVKGRPLQMLPMPFTCLAPSSRPRPGGIQVHDRNQKSRRCAPTRLGVATKFGDCLGPAENIIDQFQLNGKPRRYYPSLELRARRRQPGDIVCLDWEALMTAFCRVPRDMILAPHHRRMHFGITADPTAAWTAKQLTEALPGGRHRRSDARCRSDLRGGLCEAGKGDGDGGVEYPNARKNSRWSQRKARD
jgi:hypothetical protein